MFDDIEPDYIKEVHFENSSGNMGIEKPYDLNARFIRSRKYFSGRKYALKKEWI